MSKDIVLIIGANGQLGSVLIKELQKIHGIDKVIASDVYSLPNFEGIFELLDATDIAAIRTIVKQYSITQIYHLAAILSAKGEAQPLQTWDLNMKMMLNVFEAARLTAINKVFFPSSIAVFGDQAPLENTPQSTFLNPATVYGISKAAGENWAQCESCDFGQTRPCRIGSSSLPVIFTSLSPLKWNLVEQALKQMLQPPGSTRSALRSSRVLL